MGHFKIIVTNTKAKQIPHVNIFVVKKSPWFPFILFWFLSLLQSLLLSWRELGGHLIGWKTRLTMLATQWGHFWWTLEVTSSHCQSPRNTIVFGLNFIVKVTSTIEFLLKYKSISACDTGLGLVFLPVIPTSSSTLYRLPVNPMQPEFS